MWPFKSNNPTDEEIEDYLASLLELKASVGNRPQEKKDSSSKDSV